MSCRSYNTDCLSEGCKSRSSARPSAVPTIRRMLVTSKLRRPWATLNWSAANRCTDLSSSASSSPHRSTTCVGHMLTPSTRMVVCSSPERPQPGARTSLGRRTTVGGNCTYERLYLFRTPSEAERSGSCGGAEDRKPCARLATDSPAPQRRAVVLAPGIPTPEVRAP